MKKLLLLGATLILLLDCSAQKNGWPANTVYDIFPGDYADPSILRDGKDFYITHSTNSLLVWHSTDLLHWKPISRALPAYSRDVWAPEMIKYEGKFFIYYPLRGKIFVVTANAATGPWSTPIELNIPGIDPGIITTAAGKRYVYVNGGSMVPLSEDGLSVKGELKQVYKGWQYPKNWVVECFCLESPKLLFHKGYYYMTSAQGGTSGPATSHMAIVARSKSAEGPWENSPYNPLVHTWSNLEGYTSSGHGTIIDDAGGNWYIVYHAYQKGELGLGRHTLIAPVKWTSNGWPIISFDRHKKLRYQAVPNTAINSDHFHEGPLKLQWNLSGINADTDLEFKEGGLLLKNNSDTMKALQLITPEAAYEAAVKIVLASKAETGLMVYYDSNHFIGLSLMNGKLAAVKDGRRQEEVDASNIRYLKIKMDHYDLSLLYSIDGVHWQTYPSSFEMSGYQTNVLGEFGSLRPTIFIKGEGTTLIDDFIYRMMP